MTHEQSVQTIQTIYAAFGRGDVSGVLARVTDDGEFSFAGASKEVPWHGPFKGHAEIGRFFSLLGGAVEFERFEPLSFASSAEAVAVRLHLRYRVRATGKVVDERQVHWWTMRGEKAAGLEHFEDTAQVVAAARG